MKSRIVTYIGVDDRDIDLFESQYVVPEGMCYNSYLVKSDKIAVMDSVDPRKSGEWLQKLESALEGRTPDYLVVQHMEPDHSGSISKFVEKYPSAVIVCSAQAHKYMQQFNEGLEAEVKTVKEGDVLDLGNGVDLHFIAAPMVHWPEVIVTYLPCEKLLFSADGFGKFGVYDADPDDWACEARRYYFNICGKYGAQVSKLLEKASALEIATICPLHGPVLENEALAEALKLYGIWSSYEPETPDGILIAHASIHGNTAAAAEKLAEILKAKTSQKVAVADLCRDDMAEVIEDAFRMGTMVLACASYDGDIFPPMHSFLHKLQNKDYQRRRVALMENGSWAPCAARIMRESLQTMKDIELIEPVITLRSTLKSNQIAELEALADTILAR